MIRNRWGGYGSLVREDFFEQVTVKLGEGRSQQEVVQNPEARHLFRGPKRTQSE